MGETQVVWPYFQMAWGRVIGGLSSVLRDLERAEEGQPETFFQP